MKILYRQDGTEIELSDFDAEQWLKTGLGSTENPNKLVPSETIHYPPAPAKKKARRQAASSVELFDLSKDRSETNNLASAEPARVADLKSRYERFAKQALPMGNYARPAGFKSPKVWGEAD